jgi:hypothetical protein
LRHYSQSFLMKHMDGIQVRCQVAADKRSDGDALKGMSGRRPQIAGVSVDAAVQFAPAEVCNLVSTTLPRSTRRWRRRLMGGIQR